MRYLLTTLLCLLAGPAWADAQMAADRCEPIALAGTVADFDMGCANSWPGERQILRNMVPLASAAETGAQDSVDVRFGSTTGPQGSDPTPTGRAGREGTYLSFDGGDFVAYNAQTGAANTVVDGWMDNWHIDSGEDHTVAMTFCYDAGGGSASQTLFSTKATGSNQGVVWFVNASDQLSVTQRGSSGAVTTTSTATMTDEVCYIIGYAHSHAGNTNRYWIGSATSEEVAHNFNDTTGAATAPATFGASFNSAIDTASLFLEDTTRLYGIYINNTYMDDTAFGNLLTTMQNRHSDVDFTP